MKFRIVLLIFMLFANPALGQVNQGPDVKPPPPKRNQPSANGYYYAPDAGALKDVDAYAWDEFGPGGLEARWIDVVVHTKAPDGEARKCLLMRFRYSDSWYLTRSDDLSGGALIGKEIFKPDDFRLFKAMLALQRVFRTVPFPPKE